jgi:transcriptional regulator with XRE-family HTH domain
MTGLELYELRKELGITQGDLAKHLGYFSNGLPNRSMIARFENGHAAINSRIAMLISQYEKDCKELENV